MKLRSKLVVISLLITMIIIIYIVLHDPMVYYQTLFITGAVIALIFSIVWIYRSVSIPVIKLQQAVSHIAEGNLDYEIKFKVYDDEIGKLCDDFEKMRERLRESALEKLATDEFNRELVKNISHDIETPLTSIKGYVEGIMDGIADTPEKRDKYIKTIYNKTKEMEQLIGELTLYYKIDSNNIPFRFEKISANQYFEDCSKDLLLYLETKGIDFQYQNELKDDINVIIDPEQLRRVISNIMTNSVKYMDKDKPRHTLKMRIKEVQDMVQLEITDNGVGIAKKDMPYVFERFFRGDASRSTSSGGSGIGLSIVKRIVEVHGGKVFITSDIRKGTTVYIMIRKDQEGVLNE